MEVGVVITLMGGGLVAVTSAFNSMRQDAEASHCLSNLQRGMSAVLVYTTEHEGVLPGPVMPQIFRQQNGLPQDGVVERQKSLSWLLGPYLTPNAPAAYDPSVPNVLVDKLFRCPTASMLSPDSDFGSDTCYATPVFNYVCNTSGPIGDNAQQATFSHTDPPWYFGAWSLCDSSPENNPHYDDISWQPKQLDSIANADSEWAIGDAWYRRLPNAGGRGPGLLRQWRGTFAIEVQGYFAAIPSAPFHHTNPRKARSHLSQGFTVLPYIAFEGETNMAFLDGHVAPFVGSWAEYGEGGTVNPYWDTFGP